MSHSQLITVVLSCALGSCQLSNDSPSNVVTKIQA